MVLPGVVFFFNYNIDFFFMKICIFFIHIFKLCTCDFHKNWTFFLHSTNFFSGHKLNETSKWYLSKRDPVGVLNNSWTVQVWTYMYNYAFYCRWRQFVNISITVHESIMRRNGFIPRKKMTPPTLYFFSFIKTSFLNKKEVNLLKNSRRWGQTL